MGQQMPLIKSSYVCTQYNESVRPYWELTYNYPGLKIHQKVVQTDVIVMKIMWPGGEEEGGKSEILTNSWGAPCVCVWNYTPRVCWITPSIHWNR